MRLRLSDRYMGVALADTLPEGTQPAGGGTPPAGDTSSPDDSGTPPGDSIPGNDTVSGNTTPPGGDVSGSNHHPDEKDETGDTDKTDNDNNDNDDKTDDSNAMQEILDGLRSELSEKDDDIEGLSDSIRSFMSYMIDAEEAKAEREALEAAEAEAQAEAYAATADALFPFSGYESWDHPITVEFSVYPWGAGYEMTVTEHYDTPAAFKAAYDKNVDLCKEGGTLKDYYIRYIYDNKKDIVYDYQADIEEPVPEQPAEDLSPAILEALQSIDMRLEAMGADLSTISENTTAYYDGMRPYHERDNQLQSNILVADIAVCFMFFLLLGYSVAHGFWQRMRVG